MTITLVISDADNESAFLRRVIEEALRVYREAQSDSGHHTDEQRHVRKQSLAA